MWPQFILKCNRVSKMLQVSEMFQISTSFSIKYFTKFLLMWWWYMDWALEKLGQLLAVGITLLRVLTNRLLPTLKSSLVAWYRALSLALPCLTCFQIAQIIIWKAYFSHFLKEECCKGELLLYPECCGSKCVLKQT